MIVLPNLGPKSVDLIFYAPNVANLGFWRIVPTIALFYREKLGPMNKRGCFQYPPRGIQCPRAFSRTDLPSFLRARIPPPPPTCMASFINLPCYKSFLNMYYIILLIFPHLNFNFFVDFQSFKISHILNSGCSKILTIQSPVFKQLDHLNTKNKDWIYGLCNYCICLVSIRWRDY